VRTNLLLTLILASACGCSSIAPVQSGPTASTQPSVRPVYHVHLPGIGGANFVHDWWLAEVRHALPQPAESEMFDWICGDPLIHALQAYERNHREGRRLAGLIVERRRREPNTRLVVSAESGGCAPAVWMLEALPDDVSVDALVLISPALSQGYDLSVALRHVRGPAYVFTSHNDDFILGWGTRTFGTSDGIIADAAGRDGFFEPAGADPASYAKLIQLPYRSEWIRYLNFGGHAQAMSPVFGKYVIAPMIVRAIGANSGA
jgi:hypothetical protein